MTQNTNTQPALVPANIAGFTPPEDDLSPLPEVYSIMGIPIQPPGDTLLGDRFLCRGGAALLVGSSGLGKSSATMQMALCWSCGREAFGINPAKALRILIVQAENDWGDVIEMRDGVMKGLDFTPQEKQMIDQNLMISTEQARTGIAFVDGVLQPLIEKHEPDLLSIDPLTSYAGADITQAAEAARLLRNAINPLLSKFRCGLLLIHHTPKTTGRDTSKWRPSDWMYSGAGSADIVNWARGVLVMDATAVPGVCRFIAAKRGGRIGWRDEAGGKIFDLWFKHAPEGGLHWVAAEPPALSDKGKNKEDLFALIPPPPDQILRGELTGEDAPFAGIPTKKAAVFLKQLLKEKPARIEIIKVPRPGTRPAEYVCRKLGVVGIYTPVAEPGSVSFGGVGEITAADHGQVAVIPNPSGDHGGGFIGKPQPPSSLRADFGNLKFSAATAVNTQK